MTGLPRRGPALIAAAGALLIVGMLGACAAISGLGAYETGAGISDGGASNDATMRAAVDADGTDATGTTGDVGEASTRDGGACPGCGGSTPLCAPVDGGYTCASSCPPRSPTQCASTCVDTTSDPNNCGGCGSAYLCTGGATCQQGSCVDAGSEGGCAAFALPPSVNIDAGQWSASFKASPTWNCDAAGTTTIDSAAGTVTSTSCALGTVDITGSVAQSVAGGPNVMVVRLQGLTVTNNHVVHLQGDKPIVFLVSGDVLVTRGGRIDADAMGKTAGSGGSIAAQCGTSTGHAGTTGSNGHGGGGGGFGTAGGAGGSNSGSEGTASTSSTLQPLRGGCSGGAADQPGGAGGGAFEISASGTITIGTGTQSAILSAAGGGSPGTAGGPDLGSGGGGSGGGILLVAPSAVAFGTGGAARAHGGGSGGASQTTTAGQDGHQADDTRAAGGTTSDGCGAAGAAGGLCSGANCATASQAGAAGGNGCGGGNSGGGGGGGRIQAVTSAASFVCN